MTNLPSLAAATLEGLCPKCRAVPRFAKACRACGLDIAALGK